MCNVKIKKLSKNHLSARSGTFFLVFTNGHEWKVLFYKSKKASECFLRTHTRVYCTTAKFICIFVYEPHSHASNTYTNTRGVSCMCMVCPDERVKVRMREGV